ncbi:MAG: hypothetical protein HRU15_01960, partial [Planctomycetes bacterium]|nr:hypothetical protein [Planctomycetota bacterium]
MTRILSICIFIALVANTMNAAEPIVSVADGVWNDVKTWSGGTVPTVGDRVQIDHQLVLNTSADIGHSPTQLIQKPALVISSKGSLALAADASLNCRGYLWTHAVLEMKEGSALILDSSAAEKTTHYALVISKNGGVGHILRMRGSKAKPCTVSSKPLNRASILDGHKEQEQKDGSVYRFPSAFGGRIDAEYGHFVGLGNETTYAWLYAPKDGMKINLKHCVFDRCGKSKGRGQAKLQLHFSHCVWKNSVRLTKKDNGGGEGIFRTNTGDGSSCSLKFCDFDELVALSLPKGYVIEDCIFREGIVRHSGKWHAGKIQSFKRNILRWGERYSGGGIRLPYGETFEDCIFIQDYLSHNNPHYGSVRGGTGEAKLKGCLYWFSGPNDITFGPEGDGHMPGKALSGTQADNSLIIENCIFMPNGNGPEKERNLSANIISGVFPSANARVIVRNNTAYSGGGPGGVCIGETHPTVKGALVYVKSNLFVGSVKNDGKKMHDFGHGVTAAVHAADCDYNAGYRLIDGSNFIAGKTGKGYSKLKLEGDLEIGKHDLDDMDPQFVD